jgi:hypothetical protein
LCADLATVTFEPGGPGLTLGEALFTGKPDGWTPVIQSICIPSSVEAIPARCFSGSETLSDVTFASGCRVSVLGKAAFSSCSSLSSMFIPASVETICSECFRHCEALSDVAFDPDCRLTVLEESVF